MKCSKFFVIAFNICFLLLSTVMISAALTPRFTFGDYYAILTTGNDIGSLNLIWIGSGFVLLAVGIFGLCSALKENIHMLHLYTVILSFVIILKVVTATTSNTLSGELDYFVSHSVKHLMVEYGYNSELTAVMDTIQKEYQCCGNKGPNDWNSLEPSKPTIKPPPLKPHKTNEDELEMKGQATLNDFAEMKDTSSNYGMSIPTSCCKNKCKSYHNRGCFQVLYNACLRDVTMVRSVAMISSVLQIFGILAAYIYSRTLRDQKANRIAPVQR